MDTQKSISKLKVLEKRRIEANPINIDGFIQKYDNFIDETNIENVKMYFKEMASHFYKEGFKEGYQSAQKEQGKIC